MNAKVLFVDDDANVLAAHQRMLRKHFTVETAQGGSQGLQTLRERGPFAVVVADMRMPLMNGVEFLQRARTQAADTVRMMLTGFVDVQTAMQAVNTGSVFRFLTKPCPLDPLVAALQAGIEQFRLVTAEKELLEQTLRGSLQVLGDVVSLVSPTAFGRGQRVQRLALEVARHLPETSLWELEITAILSQIGCVAVPEAILEKVAHGRPLSPEEQKRYDDHPRLGAQLLKSIPRLAGVVEGVAHQHRRFDGAGEPEDAPRGAGIPLAARILKAILEFDSLVDAGHAPATALKVMRQRTGVFDPRVLDALETAVVLTLVGERREVAPYQLAVGMILDEDLQDGSGFLLARKGFPISPVVLHRLLSYVTDGVIRGKIWVRLPAGA